MYTLKFTSAYKKSYKLMKKRGLDLSDLDMVVDLLRQGKQLDDKYLDHPLSGNFTGFRECHIKPDWLLIYLVENDLISILPRSISKNKTNKSPFRGKMEIMDMCRGCRASGERHVRFNLISVNFHTKI